MYKVSLAIPIYNVSLFVERALLSVLNQTYDNIEYLIVDDKGQDDSMDIVHRIIKDHPRGKDVRIIEHPYNIGLGATRNTAIDNAQGEYLFFMDSDDEIIPTCIEILVHKMQEHPVDFIAASHMKKDLSGKTYPTYSPILIQGDDLPVAQYRYAQNNDIYVMSWNKLYNLNFLKSHNITVYTSSTGRGLLVHISSYYIRKVLPINIRSNLVLYYKSRIHNLKDQDTRVFDEIKYQLRRNRKNKKSLYSPLKSTLNLSLFALRYHVHGPISCLQNIMRR